MTNSNPTNNNRMMLLLIGGIPLTIILAATWLWFFVARGELDLVSVLGTANRGTLVQPPRQMDEQLLRDESGAICMNSEVFMFSFSVPGTACHRAPLNDDVCNIHV